MSDAPRYQQIVAELRGDIEAGRLAVGEELPSEAELRQRFEVSRHTVREALRALRDEGLVASRQGAASRVVKPERPLYTYAVGDVAELLQYATDARYAIDKSSVVVADAALALRLSSPAGSRWLRLEGFRHTRDDPVPLCWTEVFIPVEFSGVGVQVGRQSGTIFSLIEAMYGVRVERVEQSLAAGAMPASAASAMGAAAGELAIVIQRVYRLEDGSIALVAVNYHVPERLRINWTLRRGT